MLVKRRFTHRDVLETLFDLFCERGVLVHIRLDNGSEFTAKRVRALLARLPVKPLFYEPGSPWENGYIESFNGRMRDDFLAREIFYSLEEAHILIEIWRKHYNTVRPHSSLGYRPPVPATLLVRPSQFQPVGLTYELDRILGAGHKHSHSNCSVVIYMPTTRIFYSFYPI